MFDNNLKKFIKSVRGIKLDSIEKNFIRSSIKSYMDTNPVRLDLEHRHREYDWSNNQYSNRLAFLNVFPFIMSAKPMSIILILAMLLGGSASVAAESSLPNDFLYPVKVGVNEEVRGWFAISPEAEARWQADLMDRRLKESERLATNGELSMDLKLKIESRFEKHAAEMKEQIEKIDGDDKAQAGAVINSELETALNAHSKILNRIAVATRSEAEIRSLINKVQIQANQTSKARAELETKVVSNQVEADADASMETNARFEAAAEGKLKATENKIAEVKKFIEKMKDLISAEIYAEAQAKVKLASDTMIEGKAKLEAKAYGEAFALFQKAHRIAQEAKLLLEARNDLKVDVRLNGNGEVKTESNNDVESDKNEIRGHSDSKIELGI